MANPSDMNFWEQGKQIIEPLALPEWICIGFHACAPQCGFLSSSEGGFYLQSGFLAVWGSLESPCDDILAAFEDWQRYAAFIRHRIWQAHTQKLLLDDIIVYIFDCETQTKAHESSCVGVLVSKWINNMCQQIPIGSVKFWWIAEIQSFAATSFLTPKNVKSYRSSAWHNGWLLRIKQYFHYHSFLRN